MNTKSINFTNKFAKNEKFGISFEMEVIQTIICEISQEALQDIDPINRTASVKEQFTANQSVIIQIAEDKIRALLPNTICIGSSDV